MSVFIRSNFAAFFVVMVSVGIQLGFALGVFGPAWLSPILTLPALGAMTWLWQRSEKQNQSSQAFARLVI